QGIANANISGGESGAFAWSDERGDFRLRLPPGHHKVHLSSPPAGYLYPRDDHPLELDLREGQVQTVPFQLERALSLEGVAVDENGRPVAGAKLSFQSDDSQSPYGLPSG